MTGISNSPKSKLGLPPELRRQPTIHSAHQTTQAPILIHICVKLNTTNPMITIQNRNDPRTAMALMDVE
jgi:hypothetical protein